MVLTRRAVLSLLLSLPSAHAKAKDKGAENQALLPLTHITTDPLAVCNDGTRPGYFMSQATTQADQFNWLVYLQGGDWCYSQATCDQARDGCAKMLVGTDSAAAYPPSAHPLALRFLNAATLDARTRRGACVCAGLGRDEHARARTPPQSHPTQLTPAPCSASTRATRSCPPQTGPGSCPWAASSAPAHSNPPGALTTKC